MRHDTFKTSDLRTFKSPSEWNFFLSIIIYIYIYIYIYINHVPTLTHRLEGFQEVYLLGAPAPPMFSGSVSAWCSCTTYAFRKCICLVLLHHLCFQEVYLLGAPAPPVFRKCICLVLLHHLCFPHSPPFPLAVIFGLGEMDDIARSSPENPWQQLSEDRDRAVGCRTRSDFRQGKTFFSSPCPGRLWSTLSLSRSLLSRQRRCGSQDDYSPLTPSVYTLTQQL